MHDFHKLSAIHAAVVDRERVAVVAGTLPVAQDICNQLADLLRDEFDADPGYTVRRLNGAHSIKFEAGGSIVFLSYRSPARGMSLDRVFVPIGTGGEVLAALVPSLAVSGGPFVGY
jgi:threonine synthase